MSKKRPTYDFEDIHLMAESDGFTWDDIATKYQRAKSSIHEWYSRQLTRKKEAIAESMKPIDKKNKKKTKKEKEKENDEPMNEPSLTIDDEGSFRYNGDLVSSVTYGRIKPTDYRDISEDEFQNLPIQELVLRVDDWIRQYFPYQYVWTPTPQYLLWIIRMFLEALRNLDFGTKQKKFELDAIMKLLVLIARFHGKTTLMIGLFSWWTIDQKKSLTVICNPGKKDDIFDTVLGVMRSSMVRFYYGDFIYKANATTMKVKYIWKWRQYVHDAHFNVSTLDGGYVGTHAQWTHLEDPIQKLKVSERSYTKMKNEFDDNLRDLSAVITVTATRKGPDDFYQYLMEKGFLELRKDAIVFHKGDFPTVNDMIFHETATQRIPKGLKQSYVKNIVYETLDCPDWSVLRLLLRYWEDKNSFYSQFMNQPRPRSGGYFEENHYQEIESEYYLRKDVIKSQTRFVVIDPAYGKTTQSSDTAIACFYIMDQVMFIIELLAIEKYNKATIELHLAKLRKDWGPFGWSKIENDYAQTTIKYDSSWLTTHKLSTFRSGGQGSKLSRIEQLYEIFEIKQIQVAPWCRDKEKFENQITAYNHDPNGKWDLLDVVASGFRLTEQKLKGRKSKGVVTV